MGDRQRSAPRRAACAACQPHIPWTPPPGGVDDEHTNRRGFGRRVRHGARDGPCEELAQVRRAAVDVAADVVGVARLEVGRAEHAAGPDEVAKARREALDLSLDGRACVEPRSRWARGSTPTACERRPGRGLGSKRLC